MNLQWYVLHSQPNKEMALWREVTARGFECFYPRLHVCPVNPRSRSIRPYFPGYLFPQIDMEEVGAAVFQWMPFSSGLVAFDGIPATVPPNLIQAIRRHTEELSAVGQVAGLKGGETVTIQGGPFHDYEAIFDARLPGRERVRVLLKLLEGRELNLELPATQIQRKQQG